MPKQLLVVRGDPLDANAEEVLDRGRPELEVKSFDNQPGTKRLVFSTLSHTVYRI
jgi:hypothetical protein